MRIRSMVIRVALVSLLMAACGNGNNQEVTVLPTLGPETGVEEPSPESPDDAEDPTSAEETPTTADDEEADDEEADDEEEDEDAEEVDVAQVIEDATNAIVANSDVPLTKVIKPGDEVVGRTACSGVPDRSTDYPIGVEAIVGPPGEPGSGTPRVVIRSYDDEVTAQQAARARIASLRDCVQRALEASPGIDWGSDSISSPVKGEQLWLPAGQEVEVHNAYAVGNIYVVSSTRVAAARFQPADVDAWTTTAVKDVIDSVPETEN